MYRTSTSRMTPSFWIILFAASILFLSSCQTATTAPNGNNNPTGTLYFNADNNSVAGTDIIALDMSSGSTTRVITGGEPSITSDQKIVFVDNDLKETSLTGMPTRTIALKAIDASVDYPHSSYAEPQASPDGKYVAYSESLYKFQVHIVNRTDGTVVSSTDATGRYSSPSWTPASDGRLVVQGGYGNPGLYIIDKQFQTISKIPGSFDNAQHPRVSPDGKLILFTMNGNIQSIDLTGGSLRTIISDGNNYSRPIWSPDMKYIAFALNAHLAFADVATGTIRNLEDVYPNILNNYHNQISTGLQMDWK